MHSHGGPWERVTIDGITQFDFPLKTIDTAIPGSNRAFGQVEEHRVLKVKFVAVPNILAGSGG